MISRTPDGELTWGPGNTRAGDCPECDHPLLWGGSGWLAHTTEYHRTWRTYQLRRLRWLFQAQATHRAWLDELVRDDLVGFRWRNGVYPGWQLEDRWELPREWWEDLDDGEKYWTLRIMRIYLSEQTRENHGVDVNPATWFHKVYE